MTIHSIASVQDAYRRAAEQHPLADTEDVLEIVATEFGLPVEAVQEALEVQHG